MTLSRAVFSLIAVGFLGSAAAAEVPADLSGCYVKVGDDSGARLSVALKADQTYTAFVIAGLGIWAKATGTWSMDSDGLFFSPSNETKDWHHYMHAIQVERSGTEVVLVDGSDRFARAHGSECGL